MRGAPLPPGMLFALLRGIAQGLEGSNRVLRLVLQELIESGGNVRLGDVDVILALMFGELCPMSRASKYRSIPLSAHRVPNV